MSWLTSILQWWLISSSPLVIVLVIIQIVPSLDHENLLEVDSWVCWEEFNFLAIIPDISGSSCKYSAQLKISHLS